MSHEYGQIAETIREEMQEVSRDTIVQALDNGEILRADQCEAVVRDIIEGMDSSDFIDDDSVADSVVENWRFSDAVASAIEDKMDYEGYGALPTEVESLTERVNTLEGILNAVTDVLTNRAAAPNNDAPHAAI